MIFCPPPAHQWARPRLARALISQLGRRLYIGRPLAPPPPRAGRIIATAARGRSIDFIFHSRAPETDWTRRLSFVGKSALARPLAHLCAPAHATNGLTDSRTSGAAERKRRNFHYDSRARACNKISARARRPLERCLLDRKSAAHQWKQKCERVERFKSNIYPAARAESVFVVGVERRRSEAT